MAATVHPPTIKKTKEPSGSQTGSSNDGWGPLVPGVDDLRSVQEYAPAPASTGIWVALAAISMTFAALTSALIVRRGGSVDWRHFTLPSILYLNTAVLLASSVTLELGRKCVSACMGGVRSTIQHPARWLYATFFLGLLFVAGQYIAWRQLSAQGLYLATNPSSSFFYVFTAGHGMHVLGGLGGLGRVIRKLTHLDLRRSTLDATARYWHFMVVLWVYLLVLLLMKL